MKQRQRKRLAVPTPAVIKPNRLGRAAMRLLMQEAVIRYRAREQEFLCLILSEIVKGMEEFNKALEVDIERMNAERQCPGNTNMN